MADRVVVDEVASFEVVGAVEDELHVAEQLFDVVGREVGDVGLDFDFGVEAANLAGGSDGLGQRFGGVGFVEEHLALQVAGLYVVAVNDAEVADSGARQQGSKGRAGGTAADDGDACRGQALLAVGSDGWKQDLARVPLGEFQLAYLLSGCCVRSLL